MAVKEVLHGNRRYEWERWTDGEWRTIRGGTKKYPAKALSIQTQICDWARKNGYLCETHVVGNSTAVKFKIWNREEA